MVQRYDEGCTAAYFPSIADTAFIEEQVRKVEQKAVDPLHPVEREPRQKYRSRNALS